MKDSFILPRKWRHLVFVLTDLRENLSRRLMRAVRLDYPEEPIRPGHPLTRTTVLWFRILHYSAMLNLTVEPLTLQWLRANRKCSKDVGAFTTTFFPVHPGALDILGVCS